MHSSTSSFIVLGAGKVVKCFFLLFYLVKLCVRSVAQLCPPLRSPVDGSPPGFAVPGILQARIPERLADSSCRGSSQPRGRICASCISWIGRQSLYLCAAWEAQ